MRAIRNTQTKHGGNQEFLHVEAGSSRINHCAYTISQSSKPQGPQCNQISCTLLHVINHNKQPREIKGIQRSETYTSIEMTATPTKPKISISKRKKWLIGRGP
jgi:hypothetical protein